jgi:hypothetical protein
MELRCYACRLARHGECIEVGCSCLSCMANDKDEYPVEYPTYVGGPRVCLLLSAA